MGLNIGVIGCGRWGQHYLRVFEELTACEVVAASDTLPGQLETVKERHPAIMPLADPNDLVERAELDAVVIATPASTHYPLARRALLAGKHVLVEKPLVLTTEQGEELLTLAASAERTLMVGFTFLYNGGVRKLKQYMNGGNGLGEVYYLYATRTNLGPIRRDVNAAWDLAPHDIAIFSYLLGTQPSHVSATGSSFLHNEQDDVAFITLTYPNGVMGNIHVSWANPHRVRQVAVVGSRKRLVFDDLDSVERVRIYDKGVERSGTDRDGFGDFLLSIRDGDIVSPMVEVREPLKELCLDFVRAVETSATPLASARAGLDCVRVLLAVQRSMELGGTRVQVGDR